MCASRASGSCTKETGCAACDCPPFFFLLPLALVVLLLLAPAEEDAAFLGMVLRGPRLKSRVLSEACVRVGLVRRHFD